jgi:hypothetical protein
MRGDRYYINCCLSALLPLPRPVIGPLLWPDSSLGMNPRSWRERAEEGISEYRSHLEKGGC